ncbi:MAG: cytochrome P450 [Ilumatobacteraceae bacterium]
MITLTRYGDARDAFRSRDLRQALYDAGERLMHGVIVNLHGDEHIARRRLENRLFRRDTFAWYERDHIPQIIDRVLAAPIAAGSGDLLPLARRTMMTLSADVAGVDLVRIDETEETDGEHIAERFDRFDDLMGRLARASTVAHAVGDHAAIIAQGDEALATFDEEFLAPAIERRRDLIDRFGAGSFDEDELPRDVLTTLLRNQDRLDLPDATLLREIAYFPWVGSHSTSAQLVHAVHHMFEWIEEHPESRPALQEDATLRQRFVHESMRLHPASPIALRHALADLSLKSGLAIPAGSDVTISVHDANRDVEVFPGDPDRFDPYRTLSDGVAPWGLSFGHGTHACLGQELASGMEPDDALDHHLLGSVALMSGAMLRAGARPDPDDPAVLDTATTRVMWGRYPVRFGSSA